MGRRNENLPKLAGTMGFVAVASMGVLNRQAPQFTVEIGPFGPTAEVKVARPVLRWEIWADNPFAEVTEIRMTVDGTAVNAKYDRVSRFVTGIPEHPLGPGPHQVSCRVTFNSGQPYERSWGMKVASSTIKSFPEPTSDQVAALNEINAIRARLHLPPGRPDDGLNLAALGHSQYLSLNKTTGHYEEPGKPGFLGATGNERISAYGWIGGSWEDVSFGAKTPQESIANLFDAPYHRVPFLQRGSPAIGTGFFDDRLTIEFEQTLESGTEVSPADGSVDVPRSWHDFERPNPLRFYPGAGTVTGYPIVVAHFAPGVPKITKMFGWLTDPEGKDVPCYINTPKNDNMLTCAAMLIPKAPLRPNSKYKAGFDGKNSLGVVVRTEISFTTGA